MQSVSPEDIEIKENINFDNLKKKCEWIAIEKLIMQYKSQFAANLKEEAKEETSRKAQASIEELLKRFYPIFKKYLSILKQGPIDFKNSKIKGFVLSFVNDPNLKREVKAKKYINGELAGKLYKSFNSIRDTYGSLSNEEIMLDFQLLFLEMAKRYKQMGKNFCAYLNNVFRYEVSRHIYSFMENPINISYRNCEYEDYMKTVTDPTIEDDYFDSKYYENNIGIPDMNWIAGECSDVFKCLTSMERKLLVKYYLEEYNDRQIANDYLIHINTCNQKRRQAVSRLANELGIPESEIKRNRKSGKHTVIPTA